MDKELQKNGEGALGKLLMWAGFLLGLAWSLYRLLASQGCVLDDEWCHYIRSRSVWVNPEQLLDLWTRPGRNLVHFFVAPFGLTVARLYTLGLAVVSFLITVRVGKMLNVKALWALPLMLWFQPWFPELSYPVLTQTPFMLFWIMGVWFALKDRWHLAGACFGYLSLIRHEGILLSGLWGLWVICTKGGVLNQFVQVLRGKATAQDVGKALGRDLLYGLSTISTILLFNLASFVVWGSVPFAVYFEAKPTEMYGSGTLYHYVPGLIGGVGLAAMIFSALGLFQLRGQWSKWSLILLTYPMYFIMHSVIYWKGAFASGGYYHFLMPMAPFFALLSAKGIAWMVGKQGVIPKWRRVLVMFALLVTIYEGLHMKQHQALRRDWEAILAGEKELTVDPVCRPLEMDRAQKAVVEAGEWVMAEYGQDAFSYSSSIVYDYAFDLLETKERLNQKFVPFDEKPIGTIYVWEGKYAIHTPENTLEAMTSNPLWKQIKSFGDGKAIVFEKIAMPAE